MQRLKLSLLAAAGILVLVFELSVIGPKRVMAVLGYTPVRDVNAPGRQPFSYRASISAGGSVGSFVVPAGKRLVMEYVDAFVSPLTKLGDALSIRSTVNGQPSELLVPFLTSTTSGPGPFFNHYAVQHIVGNADPGTTVTVTFFTWTADSATVNIHGYYLDVP